MTQVVPASFERRVVWSCVLVFVVALCLRLAMNWHNGSYRNPEHSEILNIASALADKGAFADAYSDSGPTAHAAPLYPVLLSIPFRFVRTEQQRLAVATTVSTLLASLQYSLLPLVAVVCRMGLSTGLLGGLLAALLPVNYWVQTRGAHEYATSALSTVLFCLLCLHTWLGQDLSTRWAIWLGVASGVVLLTNPPFACSLLALAVVQLCLIRPELKRHFVRFTLIQFLIAAALLLPWTVRNYKVLGSPIWARSNSGLELHISNNDRATAFWQKNMQRGVMNEMQPFLNGVQHDRVVKLGEVEYNRREWRAGVAWIRSHPQRFVTLTMERAFLFWFPPLLRLSQTLASAIITIAAGLGFLLFWRTTAVASRFFLVLCISFALPLCLFQASARLRYPIEWVFYLFAGYLIFRIAGQPSLERSWPVYDTGIPPVLPVYK
jgi:hypothetical protein